MDKWYVITHRIVDEAFNTPLREKYVFEGGHMVGDYICRLLREEGDVLDAPAKAAMNDLIEGRKGDITLFIGRNHIISAEELTSTPRFKNG